MNREIVDRAWQMGARLHHPDYQPRADLYGPSYFQSTSTPPYRSNASWTPPLLNRSPQGQPNRRSRGRMAGTGNTGRGGPGPRAQQGPRSHERELGGPPFSSHNNGNGRWQSGKPHREQPHPRGAPSSPRRQHGSTYGPDIEPFKGGGKHNGVYEYNAPYPRTGNRYSPASVNGFRSSPPPGNTRAARERGSGKAEKEKKNHSKRDKAFWEEISQETDHLLGRLPLNGHQPASSAEGSLTPSQPAVPDLPGSPQTDDHPTGLETPDHTSAPQQQED
ncbi:hypothetical protein [Thermogemmatispora onikobensis]|uniref:hypothetical protein n=1 Tax=Thermogemmatispora onikobensis TaxID=732234 RepID=UPI0008529F55|nr:hypothetical protein [Thermogemmatispora onikobensis]